MTDLATSEATDSADVSESVDTGGDTLLTGDQREPDKGPGEKEPDVGEGEKAPDKAEAEAAEPEGAPEEYAAFEAPEGVTLNAELVSELAALAKEDNLPQGKAQKYVDLAVKLQTQQAEAFAQRVTETREAWVEAARTDKEYGGDKINESLATAKKALTTYGSDGLTALLNETGLGNHPEIIRLLVKVGKSVSDDSFVGSGKPAVKPGGAAAILYPAQATKE